MKNVGLLAFEFAPLSIDLFRIADAISLAWVARKSMSTSDLVGWYGFGAVPDVGIAWQQFSNKKAYQWFW